MAGRVSEELEKVGVRPQQESGVVAFQPVLIRAHRAVEREEVGILAIGFGEQPVALAVARAAHLLGGGIGLRDDHGRLAVGPGADFLCLLAALGAEFGGLALPLGLHALIDRLAVLFGKIGAADPHVDYRGSIAVGFLVAHVADQVQQRIALVTYHTAGG